MNDCWRPPPSSWTEVNVDCSLYEQSTEAACAAVFRDETGSWLMGFSRKLGICTSLQAELWNIVIGLDLAWDRRYSKLIIESDSLEAVTLIYQGCPSPHNAADMLRMI